MRTGILHVGDELLKGDIDPYPEEIITLIRSRDQRLDLLEVVGDDVRDIVAALEHAAALRIELLIVTGGLGPTLDDVTREAVAKFMGTDEIPVDEEAARWTWESMRRFHPDRPLDELSLRMARVPSGCRAVRNPTGAACGVLAQKGGMRIVCLPGFPQEMLPMFKEAVLPMIPLGDERELTYTLMHGESAMEPLFREVAAKYDVRVASIPSLTWRRDGNKVVIRGRPDQLDGADKLFRKLLDGLDGD